MKEIETKQEDNRYRPIHEDAMLEGKESLVPVRTEDKKRLKVLSNTA